MENEVKCVIKWNGKEYEVNSLSGNDTVGTLKDAIFKKTGVRPERQKLLNLKFKGKFYIYLHKLNLLGTIFHFLLIGTGDCVKNLQTTQNKLNFSMPRGLTIFKLLY